MAFAVCFPEYWQKYLEMKNYYDLVSSPYEFIDEHYVSYSSPITGVAMDYGSPYYPMGSYRHIWRRTIGITLLRR